MQPRKVIFDIRTEPDLLPSDDLFFIFTDRELVLVGNRIVLRTRIKELLIVEPSENSKTISLSP